MQIWHPLPVHCLGSDHAVGFDPGIATYSWQEITATHPDRCRLSLHYQTSQWDPSWRSKLTNPTISTTYSGRKLYKPVWLLLPSPSPPLTIRSCHLNHLPVGFGQRLFVPICWRSCDILLSTSTATHLLTVYLWTIHLLSHFHSLLSYRNVDSFLRHLSLFYPNDWGETLCLPYAFWYSYPM